MRNTHLLVAMLAAVLMLGACSSTPSLDPRRWFSKDETPAPKASETPGVSTLVASNPDGTPSAELPPSLTPTLVPPTATPARPAKYNRALRTPLPEAQGPISPRWPKAAGLSMT